MKVNRFLLVSIFLVMCSCTRNTLSVKEYLRHYQSEAGDDIRRVSTSKLSYEFRLLPPEFVALQENTLANGAVNRASYAKRLSEIHDYEFVRIKIANKQSNKSILQANAATEEEMQYRTQYYNFEASKNLYCICGKDTIHPTDYQFEENYNLSNYAIISVAFPKCVLEEMIIHFDDRAANNYGVAATLYPKSQPHLKF